jgi:tetratricopeptide (TPR) repeat protein
MIETANGSHSGKSRRRLLRVPAVLLLALFLGGGRYWYAAHTGPDRHFRAAVQALPQNDLDRIRAAAEAIQGLDEYRPHWHLLSGMILLREGRLIDSIIEFGHSREHPDTKVLAYTLSGEALYKSQQFRDAVKILGMAVQMDPAQADAHRWLAATYYDIGAMDDALDHLNAVAHLAPDDPRPDRLRGLIFKDFEQYTKAIDAYRASLKRGMDQADIHTILLELAECEVRQQQHKEAMKTLDTCPRSAQRLWLQAECFRAQGDRAAAVSAVDEAIEMEPEHLDALQLKGKLSLEAGDAESAVDTLTAAVKFHPKQWRPRYTLAMAYQRLGQTDKSAEQLKVMEELRELRDRFTKLHAQAIENSANADLRYQLGLVALQLDEPLIAAGWFDATIAMDPDHQTARDALQKLTETDEHQGQNDSHR